MNQIDVVKYDNQLTVHHIVYWHQDLLNEAKTMFSLYASFSGESGEVFINQKELLDW